MEENHSLYQLVGDAFFNSLAAQGVSFAQMHAITHPSQPNYFALFSGSTQGIADDNLYTVQAANLYDSLVSSNHTFAGYSEDLPSPGFTGASSGAYVRRHAPWVSFQSVPPDASQPFTAFPSDFSQLPTVSFVIPNLNDDMHDGTIAQADTWLATNLGTYASWARSHNSLLIVTFDEPYGSESVVSSPIPTYFVGAGLREGAVNESSCTLYSLLRLIEEIYHLPFLGNDSQAVPIVGIWE